MIILERLAKSSVLLIVAVSLLVLGPGGQITRWALALRDELNLDAGGNVIATLVERLLTYIGVYRHLTALSLGLMAYSLLEGVEGIGLAQRRRWADYLTVLATGILIPWEIVEAARHLTVVRLGALLLNAAVVGYLTYRKRLFVDV